MKRYKLIIYIIFFLLVIEPLNRIVSIRDIVATCKVLDCGFPYAILANDFFTLICILYLTFIVMSSLNPTFKKQVSLFFPLRCIDGSLLKGYYVAVIVTLLYVLTSLPTIKPLGVDVKLVLAIGTCIALFFQLIIEVFLLILRWVIDRYVEINADRNLKESIVTLGILIIGISAIFMITKIPGFIYSLYPELSLHIYIVLSLFALIFHYPIIKCLSK